VPVVALLELRLGEKVWRQRRLEVRTSVDAHRLKAGKMRDLVDMCSYKIICTFPISCMHANSKGHTEV
jgi:hypothetical protein